MNLNKFKNKLNREKLSPEDYKAVKEMKNELKNWIRDENLDEMNLYNNDYFAYSSKLGNKISEITENKEVENKEEIVAQLKDFFKI